MSDRAEHWGFRREQANEVPAGMELAFHWGRHSVGRMSDRMTAGKRMKQACDKRVGGGRGGHGSLLRMCHRGHLPCEDLQEVSKLR